MEEQELLADAARLIWKKRKEILRLALITLVVTAPLSLVLKNYYKATTVFYPASLDLSKPDQIFGNNTKEIEFYGSGQDLDRLLTICSGNELKDALIREFNLYAHYEIDSGAQNATYRIRKKVDKLTSVTKTKYDAIELGIEDHDKILAATMANRAREIVNGVAHNLVVTRLRDVAGVYKKSIDEKSLLVQKLSDSLYHLRKIYPIYNINAQTETMSNLATEIGNKLIGEQARYEALRKSNAPRDTLMYLAAVIKGLESQRKAINGSSSTTLFNLSTFNEGVNKIASLESSIDRLQGQLNEDKIKFQNTYNTIDSDANAVITVSKAEIPDYKSRPKRSLLVMAAVTLACIALSLYYLMLHSVSTRQQLK